MKFTNKEEYLAYRSAWKADYKELSQSIRATKFCNWFAKLGIKRITPELNALDELYSYQYSNISIYSLKSQARKMLAERKESKVEAQKQYLASKEQQPVIA